MNHINLSVLLVLILLAVPAVADTHTTTHSASGTDVQSVEVCGQAVALYEQRILARYSSEGLTVLDVTSILSITQNAAGLWDYFAEWIVLYSDESGPGPY